MILGLGIDLIETSRIEESLTRFGDRFLQRVFLPDEISYCMKTKFPARHLAARFAAKEAASKAFGTGIGRTLGWKDLEVGRGGHGEPFLILHGKGAELAGRKGIKGSHISLTHHESTAAAAVVLF